MTIQTYELTRTDKEVVLSHKELKLYVNYFSDNVDKAYIMSNSSDRAVDITARLPVNGNLTDWFRQEYESLSKVIT